MRTLFQNFRKSESGATLVEYGVALILAIVIGGTALINLSGTVESNMDDSCNSMLQRDATEVTTGCP